MPWVEKISIELAPTYENATAILNKMNRPEKSIPLFQLQFDGKENKDDFEMLEAFVSMSGK